MSQKREEEVLALKFWFAILGNNLRHENTDFSSHTFCRMQKRILHNVWEGFYLNKCRHISTFRHRYQVLERKEQHILDIVAFLDAACNRWRRCTQCISNPLIQKEALQECHIRLSFLRFGAYSNAHAESHKCMSS
jgi:hypothetical protein